MLAIQAPEGTQLSADRVSTGYIEYVYDDVYTRYVVCVVTGFVSLQNDRYHMHLRSSKGPINVLVLNQDVGLSSLVPSTFTVNQGPLTEGQPLSTTQNEISPPDPLLPTSCAPPATTSAADSSNKATSDSSTAVSGSVAGSSTAGSSSEAVARRGGVVTRRMRRQAELGERERVGAVSGSPAVVEVSVDDVEAMDTEVRV